MILKSTLKTGKKYLNLTKLEKILNSTKTGKKHLLVLFLYFLNISSTYTPTLTPPPWEKDILIVIVLLKFLDGC
jgi:hypothetical protein